MNELFQQASFVRFWLARIASVMGLQMLMLAIGWHMYELTGSAWDLGLVGLFQFAPALLTTLIAGQLADLVHRARMVALCQLVQMAVALVLLLATVGNGTVQGAVHNTPAGASRGLLLALSVVLGGTRPFQMSAQQALVPMLVPPPLLSRAMALSSSGQQLAVITGPAIGGLLFGAGLVSVYGVCAALFGCAAITCLFVRYVHVPPPRERVTAATLLAGLRFIQGSPLLLGAVSLDLFAVLLGGATALLPVFAKEVLHVGPQGLGLLRSAPAFGALLVGLWLARFPLSRAVGRTLLVAVGVYGVSIVVFGLSSQFWLSLAALAVSGSADMVSVVIRQTLVQLETPNAMRGRVAAINSLFIGASNQLGEFESGITAAAFGPVASVVAGGLGTLAISVAWYRLFRPLATRDTLA